MLSFKSTCRSKSSLHLLLDQIVTAMLAFFMLMAPALVSESGFGSGLHLFVDLDGVASSEGLELRQHTPTKTYEMARPAQKQTAPRAVQRAPLTPQINPGSRYRCGNSTQEPPVGHDRRKRAPETRPKTTLARRPSCRRSPGMELARCQA